MNVLVMGGAGYIGSCMLKSRKLAWQPAQAWLEKIVADAWRREQLQ